MYLSTANFKKYFNHALQSKKLAHFYLINTLDLELARQVLKDLFQQKSEANHPDLLWIESEETSFKVDEIAAQLKSIVYRPYHWPYRFIVLDHSEKMSELLSNKLLKILEEPEPFNVFILLRPYGNAVLPTISSRAMEIFLTDDKGIGDASGNSKEMNLSSYFKANLLKSTFSVHADKFSQGLDHFLTHLRSDESFLSTFSDHPELEEILLHSVMDFLGQEQSPYIDGIDKKIVEYFESKSYHMNKEQRILGLMNALTLKI